MNAHAAAAKSLREVPGLQGNYDRTAQNFRVLNQLYAAEQEKLDVEKESVEGKNSVSRISSLSPLCKPMLLRRMRVKPL